MNMETAQRAARRHQLGIFFEQLKREDPNVGIKYAGGPIETLISEDTEPSRLEVSKAYLDELMPTWHRICDIENSNRSFGELSVELQAEYQQLWRVMYPVLPDHAKQYGKYKNELW